MENLRRDGASWGAGLSVLVALVVLISRYLGHDPYDVHVRDDAYYYYCWARSLAAGDGPCVTPGVWTSGVHVLWGLLLASFAFVFGPDGLPAASVHCGLVLHVATAVLVGRATGARWIGAAAIGAGVISARAIGVIAGAAYAGAPFLVSEAMNGQETALGCFALTVFLLHHHRSPRAFLWTGAFAMLARSDLFFFILAAALVEPRARAPRLVLAGMIFGSYVGVNLILGGNWMQDSAAPIPWLIEQEFGRVSGMRMATMWQHAKSLLLLSPFRLPSTPLAVAWFAAAWFAWRRMKDTRFVWLLAGGVGLVCVHSFWRCYPRDYYFVPLGVVGALAAVRLWQLVPRMGVVLLLLAVCWNGYRFVRFDKPSYNWQREMSMAGRFVDRFVPAEEPIGSFNSGIVTWLRKGKVINLDGVVNRPAFAALQKGELAAYLRAQGVRFLLDNPVQFARTGVHANGLHFGGGFDAGKDLEEIARFSWPGDRGDRGRAGMEYFSLYRIRGEDDQPVPLGASADLGAFPRFPGRCVLWVSRPNVTLSLWRRELVRAGRRQAFVLQLSHGLKGRTLELRESDRDEPILIIAPK